MSKKMSPEDIFYDNLTMGLMRKLANVPRVCNVACEKRPPCEKAQLVNWEQRHCVYLPEDMKKFYLSTDGFQLTWCYEYAPNDMKRVGCISFPHLMQITLLRENIDAGPPPSAAASAGAGIPTPAADLASARSSATSVSATSPGIQKPASTTTTTTTSASAAAASNSKDIWGNPLPVMTPRTKIFELATVNDVAKVCLIYESTGTSNARFYLLELSSYRWQFLADTFSEYLRMAIAHLGLPYWELCFSSFGLPPWAEQLFLLMAPRLLDEHETRRNRIIHPAPETPHNILDPNVFRAKSKSCSKSAFPSKHK